MSDFRLKKSSKGRASIKSNEFKSRSESKVLSQRTELREKKIQGRRAKKREIASTDQDSSLSKEDRDKLKHLLPALLKNLVNEKEEKRIDAGLELVKYLHQCPSLMHDLMQDSQFLPNIFRLIQHPSTTNDMHMILMNLVHYVMYDYENTARIEAYFKELDRLNFLPVFLKFLDAKDLFVQTQSIFILTNFSIYSAKKRDAVITTSIATKLAALEANEDFKKFSDKTLENLGRFVNSLTQKDENSFPPTEKALALMPFAISVLLHPHSQLGAREHAITSLHAICENVYRLGPKGIEMYFKLLIAGSKKHNVHVLKKLISFANHSESVLQGCALSILQYLTTGTDEQLDFVFQSGILEALHLAIAGKTKLLLVSQVIQNLMDGTPTHGTLFFTLWTKKPCGACSKLEKKKTLFVESSMLNECFIHRTFAVVKDAPNIYVARHMIFALYNLIRRFNSMAPKFDKFLHRMFQMGVIPLLVTALKTTADQQVRVVILESLTMLLEMGKRQGVVQHMCDACEAEGCISFVQNLVLRSKNEDLIQVGENMLTRFFKEL